MGSIASCDEETLSFTLRPQIQEFLEKNQNCTSKEQVVQYLFKGVAQGLFYLHETMNFANRDIKPDNILFTTQKGGTND